MKLTLNFALPDGEVYDIECNGEKRQINLPERQAVFELDGEGEYTVFIEQQAACFLLKPFVSWLVFALTAVFRGIFYIVMQSLPFSEGGYGERWWADVRPHRLRAKITVAIHGDTEKTIRISNASFDSAQGRWILPSAVLSDGEKLETELIRNDGDFKYQYIRYARAAASVVLVGVALFATGLILGLKASNGIMTAVCAILLAACIVICVSTLIHEHKHMKKLLKSAYEPKRQY